MAAAAAALGFGRLPCARTRVAHGVGEDAGTDIVGVILLNVFGERDP